MSSVHRRDPSKFPTAQLALLALVRVAEPIALTSVSPYAVKLALSFHIGDKDHASFYAGLLIAAFSLAEALSGMVWGGISDRVGRKPVLLLGCFGTVLSLLIVGFSTHFWVALCGRLLGGLLNGNVGVIQTMVGELIVNPAHEPKAYAVMPFAWSIGTIIGPAVGGLFSEPADTFPQVFSPNGLFGKFPYLLPNLICSILLVLAIAAGYFFIEETHPDMQPWSTPSDLATTNARTPLTAAMGDSQHAPADLTTDSYGTFNQVDIQKEEHWIVDEDGYRSPSLTSITRPKIYTKRIVTMIVALGIFTYHCMTFEVMLPIFLQTSRPGETVSTLAATSTDVFSGGLGISLQSVGIILSVQGVISLFMQGVVFPVMASKLGIWRLFQIVTAGHPISYVIVPLLCLVPIGAIYPALYAVLVVKNFFAILAYPLLLILVKEACPNPAYLGQINGLAASVGAACRTLASPIAGLLYSVGVTASFTPLAWWASGAVALIGSFQLFFIHRQKGDENSTTHVRTLAHQFSRPELRDSEYGEVVHIHVRRPFPDFEDILEEEEDENEL